MIATTTVAHAWIYIVYLIYTRIETIRSDMSHLFLVITISI